MELNEKIKALRTERGLTQKELAAAVGVSNKTISKWECGRGGISLKVTILSIAVIIGNTSKPNITSAIKLDI